MHSDGGVAEHGLWTGGGDGELATAIFERIVQIVELALVFFVLNLDVRDRGLAMWAPVDDVIALVDQALFIEGDECFAHSAAAAFVHGEAFAVPVAGSAELADLLGDGVAVLLFPVPAVTDEGLAADLLTLYALLA